MAHWRTMMDNETMTAGDLAGRGDVVVTIESVKGGSVKVSGGKKRLPLIRVSGFQLPLGANPTNCTTIQRMHGPDTDGWIGKRITLYTAMVDAPDPLDKRKSIKTEAIRIRPTIPTTGDSPPGKDGPPLTEDQQAEVAYVCEQIDAAETPDAIEAVIAPRREDLKAMGHRAIVLVAAAKKQRLANLPPAAVQP